MIKNLLQVIERMTGAHEAIKAIVTDSSLTAGVNFGFDTGRIVDVQDLEVGAEILQRVEPILALTRIVYKLEFTKEELQE